MFQVTPLVSKAHVQPAREIVSDTTAVHRKFWTALGRRRTITRDEQWFQQDGATPHTSSNTLSWLRQRFEDRLISRRCDVERASHSPNSPHPPLRPHPHFYLWGYLKDRVHKNNSHTIGDLKIAITARIRANPIEKCVRVIDNFACRLQMCLKR